MVKLIRLQGDSDRSDTEIRNVFSEGVTINPKSKIGLKSCRVNFLNIEDLEIFRLPTDTTFTYKAGGRNTLSVTVPAGDYDNLSSLLTAMQKATNSTWRRALIQPPGLPNNYLGFHGRWVSINDRTNFQVYSLPNISANFSTVNGNQFLSVGGAGSDTNITRSNGGIVALGPYTAEFNLQGQYNTPLVNQRFSCTLDVVPLAEKSLEINGRNQNAASDDATIPWGFAVEDHNGAARYKLRVNNLTHTATDVVPTNGDAIRITKHGKSVTLSVFRNEAPVVIFKSGAIPAQTVSPTGAIPFLGDDELTPQLMTWNIKSSPGTVFTISNARYQAISNMGGTAGNTITTLLNIPRTDPLGSLLGFTDVAYNATGQPATTISDQQAVGRSTYPGIMVRIAAPGLDLDTYAGVQDRQNQTLSFLDVIVPQDIDAISNLIYEPMNIAMLGIKNINPIELRNCNIQFSRDDTGQPLQFTGQPMVMLTIED